MGHAERVPTDVQGLWSAAVAKVDRSLVCLALARIGERTLEAKVRFHIGEDLLLNRDLRRGVRDGDDEALRPGLPDSVANRDG